jgi:hypothetical protein
MVRTAGEQYVPKESAWEALVEKAKSVENTLKSRVDHINKEYSICPELPIQHSCWNRTEMPEWTAERNARRGLARLPGASEGGSVSVPSDDESDHSGPSLTNTAEEYDDVEDWKLVNDEHRSVLGRLKRKGTSIYNLVTRHT